MYFALLYFLRDCYNDFSTSFYSFCSTVLSMFIKLFCIIGIVTHFSIIISISFFRIIFRIFFIISCLAVSFFLSLHCSCVFVITYYMFFICLLILTIITHQEVLLFFHIYANIDKDANCLQSIITTLQKVFGYFFQPRFYL